MIGIIWFICGIIWVIGGIIIIISTGSTKKNPAKLLASEKRKKKANLSDEEYVASVCRTSIVLGSVLIILGVLWMIMLKNGHYYI